MARETSNIESLQALRAEIAEAQRLRDNFIRTLTDRQAELQEQLEPAQQEVEDARKEAADCKSSFESEQRRWRDRFRELTYARVLVAFQLMFGVPAQTINISRSANSLRRVSVVPHRSSQNG